MSMASSWETFVDADLVGQLFEVPAVRCLWNDTPGADAATVLRLVVEMLLVDYLASPAARQRVGGRSMKEVLR